MKNRTFNVVLSVLLSVLWLPLEGNSPVEVFPGSSIDLAVTDQHENPRLDAEYWLFEVFKSVPLADRSETEKEPSLFSEMPTCSGNAGTIAGFAWEDFNFNGIKEANENFGIQNLTVKVFDENDAQVGSDATSDIDGNWSVDVSGSSSPLFRVEYTNLPTWASETGNSTDGNTLVQFVAAGDCANLGVGDPSRYGNGSTMVNAYVPCHVNGDPLAGGSSGSDDWFVGYPYDNSGTATDPAQKLDGSTIGSTFGQSFSQPAQKLFVGAFLRRHSGMGTLGSGGIYLLEPTGTSFNVTEFYDLDANGVRTRADAATAPAYGDGTSYEINTTATDQIITYLGANDPLTGAPAGLGVIGENGATGRNLPAERAEGNNDPAAFDQVGKVGLGDLELSDDGRFLFVMNLYSRSIVRLELDDPADPTAVISTNVWNLDDIPGVPSCTDGTLRPFALSFYRDKLYIGAVCTNEDATTSTAGNTNLAAHVFELSDPKGTGTFTNGPIVSQTLDFNKGRSRGSQTDAFQNNNWNSWTNNFRSAFGKYPVANVYPTPWLTDIEFTDYGNMVLAFADRAGYQYGNANRDLESGPGATFSYQLGGHMLFAERLPNGSYQVESGGATPNFGVGAAIRLNGEGPGGGEFFSGAFFTGGNNDPFPPNPFMGNHPSTAMGAAGILPGQNEIFITTMDPAALFSGGSVRLDATNGGKNVGSGYQLYSGGGTATFGKAAGLGDIELSMARDLPIEIGNYVWEDTDNDGIQDPDEPGIDGLEVTLWKDDGTGTFMQVASTTTVNGVYGFSSLASGTTPGVAFGVAQLLPDMNYELRFPTTSGAFTLTSQDNGGADAGAELRDSDADPNGVVAFSTMGAGQSNLNFDVGYGSSICVEPMVLAFAIQPSCDNDGNIAADGFVQISSVTGGLSYEFNLGSTFNDSGTRTSLDGATFPLQIATGLPNPTVRQDFTVRVYQADVDGDATCFTDVVVTMQEQDCVVECDCTEYLYLNERATNEIYKFRINTGGGISEVGSPWFGDPDVDVDDAFDAPHGVAFDLNGFVYIGDRPDAEGEDLGNIKRMNCAGEVLIDDFIDDGSYNFATLDGFLFMNNFSFSNHKIQMYETCDGTLVGEYDLPGDFNPLGWGFHIDESSRTFYVGSSFFGTGDGNIYTGSADPSEYTLPATQTGSLFATISFPTNNWSIMGITTDDSGNVYVATDNSNGFGNESIIYKYSSAGDLLGSVTDNTSNQSGFSSLWGLVYSAQTGLLYASTVNDDCIATIDPITMTYAGPAVPFVPATLGKGLGIVTECCPTSSNQTVQISACNPEAGETIFLNEIFPCAEGVICEAQWEPADATAAAVFDACNLSIMAGTDAGCYTFTRSSDGTGSNAQCGAFFQTFTVAIGEVVASVVSGDQQICSGADPDPFTIEAAATGSEDLSFQWYVSTESDSTGFLLIDGATDEAYAPVAADVMADTAYFRSIVSITTCSGDMCQDTSNAIRVVMIPDIVVEAGDNVTVCSTSTVDLGGASLTPDDFMAMDGTVLGATWTSGGTGMFFNAAGDMLTAPVRLGDAISYQPSAADFTNGSVTLTLTSDNLSDTPFNVVGCVPFVDEVTITTLKVDCGEFNWDGSND